MRGVHATRKHPGICETGWDRALRRVITVSRDRIGLDKWHGQRIEDV